MAWNARNWLGRNLREVDLYALFERPLFDPDVEGLRKALRQANREVHAFQTHTDKQVVAQAMALQRELGGLVGVVDDARKFRAYRDGLLQELRVRRERELPGEPASATVRAWLLDRVRVHPAAVEEVAAHLSSPPELSHGVPTAPTELPFDFATPDQSEHWLPPAIVSPSPVPTEELPEAIPVEEPLPIAWPAAAPSEPCIVATGPALSGRRRKRREAASEQALWTFALVGGAVLFVLGFIIGLVSYLGGDEEQAESSAKSTEPEFAMPDSVPPTIPTWGTTETKPATTAANTSSSLPVPYAWFRFDEGTKNDGHGEAQWQLQGVAVRDGALFCSGIYQPYWRDRRGPEAGGYRAVCHTPNLDESSFVVALRFRPNDYTGKKTCILSAGTETRWLGVHRSSERSIRISFNNGAIDQAVPADFGVGSWAVLAISIDLRARRMLVRANDQISAPITLDTDFQFSHLARPDMRYERRWSLTNYSSGTTFHGSLDEFLAYDRSFSADELRRIPLHHR